LSTYVTVRILIN